MAEGRLVPRALIYSFQNDAAREMILNRSSSSKLSDEFAARLQKAIKLNAENPMLPKVEEHPSETKQAGRWWTIWPWDNYVRIKGTVRADCKRVGIFVNDRVVKIVNTTPRPDDAKGRRSFRFNMKPVIVRRLPRKTVLGVGSEVGYLRCIEEYAGCLGVCAVEAHCELLPTPSVDAYSRPNSSRTALHPPRGDHGSGRCRDIGRVLRRVAGSSRHR